MQSIQNAIEIGKAYPLKFLEVVLPSAGHYCLVELTTGKKEKAMAESIAELAPTFARFTNAGYDTFFTPASFESGTSRLGISAKYMRSLFIDIDCKHPRDIVETDKPYESAKVAVGALYKFLEETGLGKLGEPWLNSSGGGVHAYWPLERNVPVELWKPVAEKLKLLCKEHGLLIDMGVTADVARIMRVPGTTNTGFKGGKQVREAMPVKQKSEGDIFSFDAIERLLIAKLAGQAHKSSSLHLPGQRPNRNSEAGNVGLVEVSPETIIDLRSALLSMSADDRDLWQRMGHALKPIGIDGRDLFMEWSATSAKFDPAADAKTWDSFKPTRTGYQAVFAEAQRQGWINPASNVALSFSGESRASQVVGDGACQPEQQDAASVDPDPVGSLEKNIIPISSLANHIDVLPHVVDMLIPCDEVTLLAGHGGSGKSYVALSIGVHASLGLPFGPLPTIKSNVLFFSAEDGKRVLQLRLAKICRALKIDPAQLEGKLHLLDASDIDPALHREQRAAVGKRQQIVTETILLGTLAALVKKLDAGLVVVDNASDAFDDDEIKRARVRAFVRSLRSRIARPGRAVLLLAHVNKASANQSKGAGTEDYSGSTAWHNSVRSRLSLTPVKGEDALLIEHVKANNAAKSAPIRLEWHGGVPLVAGSYTNAGAEAGAAAIKAGEKMRDDLDKGSLVTLIQGFDKRGEQVTTSAQGGYTVFKLLKGESGFPKNMTSERLMRLLRELETDGIICRCTVKTGYRKDKQVFTCTGAAPAIAPIPVTQPVQSADEPEDGCANES